MAKTEHVRIIRMGNYPLNSRKRDQQIEIALNGIRSNKPTEVRLMWNARTEIFRKSKG